jgi:hypothetical protein
MTGSASGWQTGFTGNPRNGDPGNAEDRRCLIAAGSIPASAKFSRQLRLNVVDGNFYFPEATARTGPNRPVLKKKPPDAGVGSSPTLCRRSTDSGWSLRRLKGLTVIGKTTVMHLSESSSRN